MRRALPHLLALFVGVAAALLVGCGDRSNLIPGGNADALNQRLDAVRSAVAGGDCQGAGVALSGLKAEARALPTTVDRRLRRRINQGIRSLDRTVPKDCKNAQTQTETTTVDTTTIPTTPATTQVTTVAPTPTVTTPTTTTPTTTTPTTTTPIPTTPSGPPATTPSGGTPGDGQ